MNFNLVSSKAVDKNNFNNNNKNRCNSIYNSNNLVSWENTRILLEIQKNSNSNKTKSYKKLFWTDIKRKVNKN